MILSEEKQSELARVITDGIWHADLVDYSDEDRALRAAKTGISKFVKEMGEIDVKARETISNLKRNIPEGSPEWDVMYSKYFEEEMKRRGI